VSAATVRAALKDYFADASIDGLNKVFGAPPYWADGSEWNLADNLGSGAIAAVHLASESETRVTLPATTGSKNVVYQVGLMVFYQYLLPSATLTPIEEDAWCGPLDDILDGVKARLRADPNCGMPSVIWQAGLDKSGNPNITIQRDLPRRLAGKVLSWNVVEFTVDEIVTA